MQSVVCNHKNDLMRYSYFLPKCFLINWRRRFTSCGFLFIRFHEQNLPVLAHPSQITGNCCFTEEALPMLASLPDSSSSNPQRILSRTILTKVLQDAQLHLNNPTMSTTPHATHGNHGNNDTIWLHHATWQPGYHGNLGNNGTIWLQHATCDTWLSLLCDAVKLSTGAPGEGT